MLPLRLGKGVTGRGHLRGFLCSLNTAEGTPSGARGIASRGSASSALLGGGWGVLTQIKQEH